MSDVIHKKIRKTATPRTGRMLDAMRYGVTTAGTGGGGGSAAPQYWQLVTTADDGTALDAADYFLRPVQDVGIRTRRDVVAEGDVIAYSTAEGAEDSELPKAGFGTGNFGLVAFRQNAGIVIGSDGLAYVDPDYAGGGGIDTEELAAYLSSNNYAKKTDNVASASKLFTKRLLWGQEFDGTLDVSGNMTGVGTINALLYPNTDGTFDVAKDKANVWIRFSGGNAINGVTGTAATLSNLYFNYKDANHYVRVDASDNLTATGDVIAYAVGSGSDAELPVASASSLGLVKIGSGISVAADGTISASGGGLTEVYWDDILEKPTNWAWSAISGKPSTYPPSSHTHAVSQISDFPDTWAWSDISGKPSTFTPSSHTHTISQITDRGSLFTAMSSSSGTNLSVTVGGTTRSVSDLYATYAERLLNSRTLWGQSFNGTANVSGNMTGVGSITMSGQLISSVATGTKPISVSSTTLCNNLNADMIDGRHLSGDGNLSASDFDALKGYVIDLESYSSSNFYPVTFNWSQKRLHCFIHSSSRSGSHAWNRNIIEFLMTHEGWSDAPKKLTILNYGCYTNTEVTIGSIGYGTHSGAICVWLRGGSIYWIMANRAATLRTSNTTIGDETFTVGTTYHGGTNTNVEVAFTPQSTITSGAFFNDKIKVGGTITATSDVIAYSTGSGTDSSLPVASASTLGLIKVGSGLSINSSGVLSVTGGGGGGSNVEWGTATSDMVPLYVDGAYYALSRNNHSHGVSTSGSGNAVTGVSFSGRTMVLQKNSTFSLNGHTHSNYALTSHTHSQYITGLSRATSGSGNVVTNVTVSGSKITVYFGNASGSSTASALASSVYTPGTKFSNGGPLGVYISGGNGIEGRNGASRGNLYFNYSSGTTNVGIDASGNLKATSTGTYSDLRLKTVLREVSGVLDKMMGIPVIEYFRNDLEKIIYRTGFGAQSFLGIFDACVMLDDDSGYYMINETSILGVTFQGVKELYTLEKATRTEVDLLKERVTLLEDENAHLWNMVNELKGKEEAA